MASNRIGRINEEVQRELASLLREVKDPRVSGLISITNVEVTSDLRFAKISVSTLESEKLADTIKGLRSAAGFLRRELGARLNLRHTPQLQFVPDDSIAYGAYILDMLNHVKPANPENENIVLPEDIK